MEEGLTPEIIGTYILSTITEEDQKVIVSAYRDAMEKKIGSSIPLSWRNKKNGNYVKTNVILVPLSYKGEMFALHFISVKQNYNYLAWVFGKFYIGTLSRECMAATPPGPRKRKLEYNVDQAIYDEFIKACSKKGYAPQIILEQAMKKFVQTGQI